MRKIGKMIMTIGAFISIAGACAIDSDGLIYSRVLLIIMIGIITALAGYGLICLDDFIPDIKKSHPICFAEQVRFVRKYK